MKRLLLLVAFFATLQASAQQVNPVPDYVFRNQMSVGRGTVTDTAAYFSIGPRYGANKGFMPPIVGDTATFSSGKRNGLLIFSVQKNKFLYWDSVRVQWSDMAGSSGSYITGSGIAGYLPQFSASTTLDTSALFTLGNRLGIGTSTFAYNSTNTANMELNGTAGGILGFKRNDSARGYLWHTGDNMELANTVAGSISFNTNSATRGSISSAGVWRLNNLAGTGDRVVQASSNGTLSATTSVTGLVDTLTLSTRAWRQKAVDSLQANINAKGSGTVTSVATGYGLSGGTITTTGTLLVDTLNIATRAWRQKGLDSLAALEVSGSGTTNYIPKFTAASTIGNSIIQDNGTDVGIGSNSAGARLEILRTATGAANNNTTGSVFGSLHASGGGPSAYGFAIRHNGSAYAGISGSNFVAQLVSSSTNSNALEMYTTGATPLVFGTLATERLRITSGGNVGIGDASPTDLLVVNGRMRVNGTNRITFGNNSGGYAGIGVTGATTGNLTFNTFDGTSDGERLRIFANGRVGINTTTDAGYQLDINGTLRSVNGANFATTSGQVGIGKTSPSAKSKLDVEGNIDIADGSFYYLRNSIANTGSYGLYYSATSPRFPIRLAVNADPVNQRFFEIGYHKNDNKDSTWNPAFLVNSYNAETFINTTSDAGDYKLQVSGNIYNTGTAVLAATSGNVGIGTASPATILNVRASSATLTIDDSGDGTSKISFRPSAASYAERAFLSVDYATAEMRIAAGASGGAYFQSFYTNGTERARYNSAGELLINTTTDAGDYKLQVSGNALVTAGKLDITTNTAFGLSVSRSGTSVVAGQINNSNGILYYGAESSTGGGLFTGSSAYAAVIGSGAAYPLQFATNNVTRATLNTDGELLINTLSDQGAYNLQVNGSMYNTGQVTRGTINTIGTGAQLSTDSTTNIPAISINQSLTGASAQSLISATTTWNTTGNPSLLEFNVTNTASGATANYLRISDGTNIFRVTKDAGLFTSAPSGGTARKWKFGSAATVSPTSPNRTIQIEVDGVVYYLHAKTTND